MMPDNEASSRPVPDSFLPPRDTIPLALTDYDNGPVAISDTSRGLMARQWRGRWVDGDVIYDAPGVAPVTVYSGLNDVTDLSITFDQNGRPCFAYADASGCHMYWYNTLLGDFDIYDLDEDAISAKVALDDKRAFNLANSDILLLYVMNGNVYMRRQRDRFGDEYLLSENVGGHLRRIGMSITYRFQWEIGH